MANSQQQARTRAAGSGSILYTRAILEHPDESWTPPSSKPQPLLQHRSPDGDCITHAAGHEDWSIMEGPGELFVDGSCTTHPVAECRRAAWAVVRVLDDGTPAAWCRGAVPSDLPQSAQAAEYFAAGVSGQVAAKDTVIRSDCLNVVKHFNADAVKQLSRRRRYAGVVRSARSYEGFNALQNVQGRSARQREQLYYRIREVLRERQWCGRRAGQAGPRIAPRPKPPGAASVGQGMGGCHYYRQAHRCGRANVACGTTT